MATLNEKMQLARDLFGREPAQGETRVYATATSSSVDGVVTVDIGGEEVSIPAVGAIAQGQEALVQVQNGHPVAIGAKGWGDSVQDAIDEHSETLSYVWLDEYGRLRVTPEPREDNPTTGVTVSAAGVDIASNDYTASVDAHGLMVKVTGGSEEVIGLRKGITSMNSAPAVVGRYGVQLIASQNADLDTLVSDYSTIELEDTPNSVDYGTLRYVIGAVTHENARQVVFGMDTVGEDANGYVAMHRINLGGEFYDHIPPDMVVLSYGHSTWQDFLDAYNSNAVVYCRASSNSNPGTGAQTRMAFMAYVNSDPPTNVEFQYYRSVSSHSATQQGDQVYIYKLTSAGTWTVTVREASVQVVADTGLTRTYTTNKITLGIDDTGWVNVATGIRARVVGKIMTVAAIGYTTDTTSGWATVGTLPASVTGGAVRFLACKYSDGTTRRGEIDGNTLKLHQPGTAIGVEFTVTVPVG